MISEEAMKWIEAGKILSSNSKSIVPCPKCGRCNLSVHDVINESESIVIERKMQCPECGAKNYIRLHRST